eukprot:3287784-Amphidinium_carterae.1
MLRQKCASVEAALGLLAKKGFGQAPCPHAMANSLRRVTPRRLPSLGGQMTGLPFKCFARTSTPFATSSGLWRESHLFRVPLSAFSTDSMDRSRSAG